LRRKVLGVLEGQIEEHAPPRRDLLIEPALYRDARNLLGLWVAGERLGRAAKQILRKLIEQNGAGAAIHRSS